MQDVKSRFTDRLESALTQLSDSNTRYANLLTSHDLTREELERVGKEKVCLRQHIESLERKIAQLQNDMEERETLVYFTTICNSTAGIEYLIHFNRNMKLGRKN
jgi:hypothetical protein